MTFRAWRWVPCAGLGLAVVALCGVARASDPAAERLYEEGRQAAELKDWARACDRFQKSQEREPAPGTLLNLANCEENRGQLRSAGEHFEQAAQSFHAGDERVGYAQQRAAAVQRRLARLVVRLEANASRGAAVEIDGASLGEGALGKPAPVDPGDHVLVVTAPGHATVRTSLKLGEGEAREIVLSVGPPAAPSNAAVPVVSSPAPSPAARYAHEVPGADARPSGGASHAWQTAGWVGVGVGAAGIVLGSIGGLVTLNDKSAADAHCRSGCDPTGLHAESNGKTWSTVSTASFIAGGAFAAAGVSLLLLAPSKNTTLAAQATAGGAGLALRASF